MTPKTVKPPQKFRRKGKTYIGHAVAIRSRDGMEIIILAPTLDEAEAAAHEWGHIDVNRDQIQESVLMGIAAFDKLGMTPC